MLNRLRQALQIIGWRAIGVLLLLPAHALARAGGGGGFHGGGGGGHGGGFGGRGGGGGFGGHGGGGDGGLFWLLYQLFFSHPAIGIPLLILIIFLIVLYYRNQNPQGMTGPGGQPSRNPYLAIPNSAVWAGNLREKDPGFDEEAFRQRVALAFNTIQAAWCAQDLKTVRAFISDGVYERFLLQIAEQRDEGYHDFMDGLRILDLRLAEVESDGVYDEIAIRVRAISIDYRMSLATGKRIAGSGSPSEFTEIWTFVRRQGAVTHAGKPGLIEGNCPNCGAAIEMNQAANCTHCKALLRSGEYDWVLSEITQESEWDGARHRQIPGLDDLRRRDPNFNAAEVEDRASVAFWRWATADRLGKIDPLRKVASAELCQAVAAQFHPPPGQPRVFMGDCAVGSVRLLGVMPSNGIDRAVVEARWNGKRFAAVPDHPPRQVAGEVLFHTVLVFFRQSTVTTDLGKGISSAHCPSCGAPESGGTSNACEYCGAVLTDGTHGWVLSEFLARLDPRAQALLAELHSGGVPAPSWNG